FRHFDGHFVCHRQHPAHQANPGGRVGYRASHRIRRGSFRLHHGHSASRPFRFGSPHRRFFCEKLQGSAKLHHTHDFSRCTSCNRRHAPRRRTQLETCPRSRSQRQPSM